MTTIKEAVSRIRNTIKGVNEDAFLTDRFIYSLLLKYATYNVRKLDNEAKIMRIQSLFERLSCVPLIELSTVDACCFGIKTNCTIMRTKDPLPEPMEGSEGPLIRSVNSIDGSISLINTNPTTYQLITKQSTFKYNKNQYYWYLENHLYFPNIEWEAISIDGIFTGSTHKFHCKEDNCFLRQNDRFTVPEFIFAEIEQQVLKDIGFMIQIPSETKDDKISVLRS